MSSRACERAVVFRGLLKRSPTTNLDAAALRYSETAAADDRTLYRIRVEEGLPHPKVDGEWTVPRAQRWVKDCIETFRYCGEICITGGKARTNASAVSIARP